MNDESKTKQQLIAALTVVRRQLGEAEESVARLQQNENALRESEELYRILIETSPDPIILYNLQGELLAANRQAAITYGVSDVEELLREVRTVFDLLTDDGKAYAETSFRHTLAEGTPQTNEYQVKIKGGKVIAAEMHSSIVRTATGEPRAFISVVRDITDRKKAEATLRENEEQFRSVVEKSLIGIAVIDDAFRYAYVNEEFCKMAGYARTDILGRDFTFLLPEESSAPVAERNRRRLRGEDVPAEYEFTFMRKNGDRRLGEVRSSLYLDSAGRKNVIIQVIDITERKQAEKALQESEEIHTRLVNNIPDFIIRTDLEGTVLFVNDYAIEKSGYTRKEVEGRNMLQFIAPEDRDKAIQNTVLMMDARLGPREYRLIMKDGTLIPFEVNSDVLRNNEGTPFGLVNVCRDISERKQAEKSLQESEEKYRGILENMDDAYYETDLPGNYIFFNEAMVLKTGYLRQELMHMNYRQLISPEAHQNVTDVFMKVYNTRRPVRLMEYDVIRKDGSRLNVESWVGPILDQNNRPVGYKGMARDVTERRQAQKMSRESEEKFMKVFMTAPDCIAITRLVDGRNIEVNLGFEEMTGWKRSEVIGRTSQEINFWARPSDRDFLLQELKTGRVVRNHEFQFRRKDGSLRTGVYSARSIDIAGEQCLIFILQDMTEKMQLAEERLQLKERLNRAEKMEALGQLAGGVAHDLNNVLGILSGYSELLVLELPEGQKARKHAEMILKSTERGAAIIQDLLTLARRGVTASDVVNLNAIVTGFLRTPVFDKIKDYYPRVDFRTECQDGLLNIKGSPVHLEKTLMNLIANAAESISGGGEVTIRTESRYLDTPVRGYDEIQEGDYTILAVSDTGTGIKAEHIEKIFEPFYTNKKMGRSGTGLGLAIVWGTVKDHHGYIDIQTKMGEGTIFTLYFPATREELSVPQKSIPVEQYTGNGESVLVVDDIAEQRDVASALLKKLGYKVHTVSSGEEAVEYLKGNQADLLILDMIMTPGIDGLETYRRILQINPKQKAILVSGFSETNRVREAQKSGAGAYVKKPYVMEKIGLAIRDELRR